MKKATLLTLLLALLWSSSIFAQGADPINWQSKLVQLKGNTYEVQAVGTLTAAKWHIYDLGPYVNGPNPTTFTVQPSTNAKLLGKPYILSKVNKKYNDIFEMEIGTCDGTVIIAQKIELTNPQPSQITALVEWQACDDNNCLPPTEHEFTLKLPAAQITSQAAVSAKSNTGTGAKGDASSTGLNTATMGTTGTPGTATGTVESSAESGITPAADRVDSAALSNTSETAIVDATTDTPEKNSSLWAVILEAILWGFVALLTPCVFPMVPMTVSFFLKNSQAQGKKSNGKFMAALYGISIVALYTLPIAVIIFVTYLAGGETVTADIFNWLATHWLPNLIFFLIFMIFAASFFGAFEITLPSWMVNKSDSKSDKGGLIGVFFMALTLVLVSFSCTGPIVGTILIKSTQGEIWEPIITMFAFSVAFALPFTIFAFAPSLLKDLPKSGGWLNSVKVVLGFIEVALGFKFLSVADQTYHWGILDREVYLAIWIVVFSLLGCYLLGKLRFAHDDKFEYISVKRLAMAIVTFSFVVYMIPGMWGAPLKALSGYLPPVTSLDFDLSRDATTSPSTSNANETELGFKPKYSDFLHLPHGLEGFFDYNEAVDYAQKVGKPLFVDFTGHGCVNCREMEARVWSDPRVLKLLKENYVLLALYADDKKEVDPAQWITTENGKVLKTLGKINSHLAMTKFNVNAQPYYTILDPSTQQAKVKPRGYDLNIDNFLKFLESGL